MRRSDLHNAGMSVQNASLLLPVTAPWIKHGLIVLGVIVSALLLGYGAIHLSSGFEFHEGFVSWYFPHAIRVTALFLLPFRQWSVFLFFTIIGSDTYYHVHMPSPEGITLQTLETFAFYFGMEWVTGACIYGLYRWLNLDWFSMRGVFWIAILSILYRLMYLAGPAFFKSGFFALMPADRYVEFFISIQISGYIVGFYGIVIAYISQWLRAYRSKITREESCILLMSLVTIFALSYWIVSLSAQFEYLLRIAIIIPFFLFAIRFGMIGALVYAFSLVTILFVRLHHADSALLLTYQPFVLSYLLIGLLTTGVLSDHSRATRRMRSSQRSLEANNKRLQTMTERSSLLTQKILKVQEQERQYLSQELHDEVGHALIKLKSSLRNLEKRHAGEEAFDAITRDLDKAYHSVYELMHWLVPSVLEARGLYQVLQSDHFEQTLAHNSVGYVAQINAQTPLTKSAQVALYRICQEAVNNTMKHSNASLFSVSVLETNKMLTLCIQDNGYPALRDEMDLDAHTAPFSAGLGLNNMTDRVETLGGTCEFVQRDGFTIRIHIPLSDVQAQVDTTPD